MIEKMTSASITRLIRVTPKERKKLAAREKELLEAHERDIVGVTRYADPNEELKIPLLEISEVQERRHLDRLARVLDGAGEPHKTTQLVIVGEMSGIGGEVGWQFRRAS